ncbi:MAG: alpha/beta fold hydrolase [Halobacteriota archaeon]
MEEKIPVDEAEIYVRREGVGGKPIMLVHGIALDSDMWRYQVPYLKQRGYEVVTLDLRGFGQSQYVTTNTPAEYTYERWAKDLDRVIQHYGLQHVTMVGYSMGGAVVMEYMMNYSGSVDKFVLVDAAGPYMQEKLPFPDNDRLAATCLGIETFRDLVIAIGQAGDDQAAKAAANNAFEYFWRLTFPTIRLVHFPDGINGLTWVREMFEGCTHEALVSGLTQMHDTEIKLDGYKINTPITVCHGLLDPFVPFGLGEKTYRDLRPYSDLEMIMAGHGLFFEQARELNHVLTGEPVPECRFTWCPIRRILGS